MQRKSIIKNSVRIVLCIFLLMVLVQGMQAAETYTFVTKWGEYNYDPFNSPSGVAVDKSSGSVYIADTGKNRIMKFDPDGIFTKEWGKTGTLDGELQSPSALAVDSSGNVFVVDTGNNRIQKFSSTGSFLMKWGINPLSYGIAVDPYGNVYVTDNYSNKTLRFSSTWIFIGELSGIFSYPSGIAVDSSGNVYVANSGNNRTMKFDSDGVFLTQWGSSGSGNGQFNQPYGVAVDSSNNVYVTDCFNNRTQMFDSNGIYKKQWGYPNPNNIYWWVDGQFFYPKGIGVDSSGNFYVADSVNNRIQKFNSTTSYFITKWGGYAKDGALYFPTDVAIDSSGNVYVVDTRNYRTQKFNSTGGYLAKWGFYGGYGDRQFYVPSGIAVDK